MRTRIGLLLSLVLLCSGSLFGCEIENCEHGAICRDDDGHDSRDSQEERMCKSYCGRLSVCGGPQAADFQACLDSCATRFEAVPTETWELCACAETSRCSDVIEGRCTPPASASGGQSGCPNGGCNNVTGGASNSSGGSSSGGASNSTGGAEASGGAAYSGGSSSGGAMGGNESSGGVSNAEPCNAACDCASGQRCLEGFCSP